MVLLEEAGVLKVSYEAESQLQVHEWFDYNPEDSDPLVLDLLESIYRLLLEYPVEKVLVKADRAHGAFSPEVQAFIREVQFPRLVAKTQMRFVATVKSFGDPNKIGTELWREQLENHSPLVTHDVETEAEAREWLNLAAAHSVP